MGRIKQKLKLCKYCDRLAPIFKNTKIGPQCWNCWRRLNVKPLKNRKMPVLAQKIPTLKDTNDSVKRLDNLFSLYLRVIHKHSGVVKCYTCDISMASSVAQCGHFIPRAHLATRWLLENCRPQCYDCNVTKHGNLLVFKERLEKEKPGITEQLELLSKQLVEPSESDIKEAIEIIKRELGALMPNE